VAAIYSRLADTTSRVPRVRAAVCPSRCRLSGHETVTRKLIDVRLRTYRPLTASSVLGVVAASPSAPPSRTFTCWKSQIVRLPSRIGPGITASTVVAIPGERAEDFVPHLGRLLDEYSPVDVSGDERAVVS
jgi:hypothetical protein